MATTDKRLHEAIVDARKRATRVKTRWFKAARDGAPKGQISDGEKALLVRMIALEILHAKGFAQVTEADL